MTSADSVENCLPLAFHIRAIRVERIGQTTFFQDPLAGSDVFRKRNTGTNRDYRKINDDVHTRSTP
jgi:hypothetical protein